MRLEAQARDVLLARRFIVEDLVCLGHTQEDLRGERSQALVVTSEPVRVEAARALRKGAANALPIGGFWNFQQLEMIEPFQLGMEIDHFRGERRSGARSGSGQRYANTRAVSGV